ncbi:MAG: acyl carrier protein [Actinobacteria bacterium]|nr:acyl carrier protein [Actinomycetota bacterium]MCA1721119.1 acyl carrier protein [Actinomycetota bacterium]
MQRAEVLDVVRQLAGELLDAAPASVTDATHFVDDLAVDSLALVEYAMALEDALSVRLSEDELSDVQTVGQLVDLLTSKRAAA